MVSVIWKRPQTGILRMWRQSEVEVMEWRWLPATAPPAFWPKEAECVFHMAINSLYRYRVESRSQGSDVRLGMDSLRGGVQLLLLSFFSMFLPHVLLPHTLFHVPCPSVFTTSANGKSQLLDHIKPPKVGEEAVSVSSTGHMWSCHPLLIKGCSFFFLLAASWERGSVGWGRRVL